uniref:Adaptor related protein complex 1 subunit sigma 1 n=1 Tax=Macaca fascicularis TaxID=9541 RepID=A0A7N9CBX0_MACFA
MIVPFTSHPFSRLFAPQGFKARGSHCPPPPSSNQPTGQPRYHDDRAPRSCSQGPGCHGFRFSASSPARAPRGVGACAVCGVSGVRTWAGRGGASAEREGSRRKDKKGSGTGAYGGRSGTRRAGGCRMVCELDIIFNFEKAYFILDEFLMGGDVQDTSKKSVLKAIEQADLLQEEDESPRSVLEEMGLA